MLFLVCWCAALVSHLVALVWDVTKDTEEPGEASAIYLIGRANTYIHIIHTYQHCYLFVKSKYSLQNLRNS